MNSKRKCVFYEADDNEAVRLIRTTGARYVAQTHLNGYGKSPHCYDHGIILLRKCMAITREIMRRQAGHVTRGMYSLGGK